MDKYVIGLTGGIGSGKSMVLELIKENYNAKIIDADKVGHSIMKYGEKGYDKIVKAFGEKILLYDKDNTPYIDRKTLGSIVFASDEALELLNNITHPLIHEAIQAMIEASDCNLIIVEAAILTETSLIKLCDSIWYIYADKEIRLKRLLSSRGISYEKALQIMDNQPDEYEYKNKSDVIIDNSSHKENTLLQIRQNLPGGNLWVK